MVPYRTQRCFAELPANGFRLIHWVWGFFGFGFFLLSCPEKTTEFIAAGNTSPRFAVTAKHAVILAECGPLRASQGASHQHPLTKEMTPL